MIHPNHKGVWNKVTVQIFLGIDLGKTIQF